MKTKKQILLIVIFLILIPLSWYALLMVPGPDVQFTGNKEMPIELPQINSEDTIYEFYEYWDRYEDKFYSPEDLANKSIRQTAKNIGRGDSGITSEHQYATYAVDFKLEPNESYGIRMRSADYAMRIYINGKLTDTVGNPASNPKENIPRVVNRTYYFTPEKEITTIVVHVSNFVHDEGAYGPLVLIGNAENIAEYAEQDVSAAFIIMGALFTAFLYHLGLFVLNHRQKNILYFSLISLLLMLRSNELVHIYFPNYNWQVAIRLEYLFTYLIGFFMIMYLQNMFPNLLNKVATSIYYVICVLYILSLALSTQIFTGLLPYFQTVSLVMMVYAIVRFIPMLKKKIIQVYLLFAGILVFMASVIFDILNSMDLLSFTEIPGTDFIMPIGMLLFIFCNSLVLSIDHAEKDKAMAEAKQMIADAEDKYVLLLNSKSEKDPILNLKKIGLSKREMEVTYLLVDGKKRWQIADILYISMGSVNTYCSRIYRKTGAKNIPELIRKLKL